MNDRNKPPVSDFLQPFLAGEEIWAWKVLGCRRRENGHLLRVWAPHAVRVCLMGDFNGWDAHSHPFAPLNNGVWELWTDALEQYSTYKFAIHTADGRILAKADPFAFHAETRPATASKVYDLSGYTWGDEAWMAYRLAHPAAEHPLNIYEIHLGSWRRTGEGKFLSYREAAPYLIPYVKQMGFTHVELMPLTEHTLDDSWGYQCTGYFAATSRFGTPHDLMYLIDQLHQAGIGVILDWVPAHFPKDNFGLFEFDGTPTYEYADPHRGEQPQCGTRAFDYGRREVRSFLLSSAMFWLEEYHIDGLRVGALDSILRPVWNGGRQDAQVAEFFRQLNGRIAQHYPDVLMIADGSAGDPRVTRPICSDGLGFTLAWENSWVDRALSRRETQLSLSPSAPFILPLSHDKTAHGKGSFLEQMPGSGQEKFSNARTFYTYMLTQPGKKLTMMGSEFGQRNEWHCEHSLDWHLLESETDNALLHRHLQEFIRTANALYLAQPALWEQDFSPEGFQLLCPGGTGDGCAAFLRRDGKGRILVVLCNFSPLPMENFRLGVPFPGRYCCLLHTDDVRFGGGTDGPQQLDSHPVPCHGQQQSVTVDLPPRSAIILRCAKRFPPQRKGVRSHTAP